jgi:hypothetical protein
MRASDPIVYCADSAVIIDIGIPERIAINSHTTDQSTTALLFKQSIRDNSLDGSRHCIAKGRHPYILNGSNVSDTFAIDRARKDVL